MLGINLSMHAHALELLLAIIFEKTSKICVLHFDNKMLEFSVFEV